MTTQPLDLDAIEARRNAATPGPWKIELDYCDCAEYGCSHPPFAVAFGPFASFENTTDRHHADAEFAAHAPTDIAAMAAEIRRLRTELAEYEVLNPQRCPAGKHADWLVDSEHTHACPWCENERLTARVTELETYAYGCDAEGCTLPHSSWCEAAKKAAAANQGCTCGQPWTGHPQPHAMRCWTVNPPRNEVDEMREKVAEVTAGRDAAAIELREAARKAIARAEAERGATRTKTLATEADEIVAHCPDHGSRDAVWMNCHCAVADDMRRRATRPAP